MNDPIYLISVLFVFAVFVVFIILAIKAIKNFAKWNKQATEKKLEIEMVKAQAMKTAAENAQKQEDKQ